MRYFLGVHRFIPALAVTGDVGWILSMYRRWISMLRFWNRIINVSHEQLLWRIFEIDYTICDNNWCAEIKDILGRLDLDAYFNNKLPLSLDMVRNKVNSLYAST